MSTDIEGVAETIANMTLQEAAKLVEILGDKYGIKAAEATVVQAQASENTKSSSEEKTSFNVFLKSAGQKKIEVIKAIRAIMPELSLKEAKDFTDKAPCMIKENMSKEEANNLKTKLEEFGAEIELK